MIEKLDLNARRPGIDKIIEELKSSNPRCSDENIMARAKDEWHRRQPHKGGDA